MTSLPSVSASTTLHRTDSAAAAAVTTDDVEFAVWTTSSVDDSTSSSVSGRMTASPAGGDLSWTPWTATATASDATMALWSSTVAEEELSGRTSDADDAAYQRLKNLSVIVAVYAVVLVAMIVLACRRRQTGVHYGRVVDWTDLEVCGGGYGDNDEVGNSAAAFERYWDTRRDVAERQRLLDSLRVDNISSVAAGHLIDRLPEHVVWSTWTAPRDVVTSPSTRLNQRNIGTSRRLVQDEPPPRIFRSNATSLFRKLSHNT